MVVVACFPFVFSQILPLLTYAGLLVVPVGAIVSAEHQIFPKIGYTRYWSKYQNYVHSTPAIASWIIGLVFGFGLNILDVMSFYYLFIPTWCFTILVYTFLAGRYGAKEEYVDALAQEEKFNDQVVRFQQAKADQEAPFVKDESMFSKALRAIALLSLIITLYLAGVVLFGSGNESSYIANRETFYKWGFVCTLFYFATAYWAMKRGKMLNA